LLSVLVGSVAVGDVGVMDVLAFAPAIGFGVQRLRGISNQCFLEDTTVLAGTADGEMVSRNIQDIQVGDLVWTRSSDNPDAPLELREVTAVYRNITYSVQRLTVEDEMGNINQISVTPDHEFYSASRNAWIRVADLVEGEWLVSADGRHIQVVTNVAEACPEGLVTYNMQVAGGHTYFVADSLGQESWTWVHNTCLSDTAGALAARATKNMAKNGIYEFVAESGHQYVGQSGNITARIAQHLRSGTLLEKDLKTLRVTGVLGGKTLREIAEQLRINQLGGKAGLHNMVNPIGLNRSYLLPQYAKEFLGYTQ